MNNDIVEVKTNCDVQINSNNKELRAYQIIGYVKIVKPP